MQYDLVVLKKIGSQQMGAFKEFISSTSDPSQGSIEWIRGFVKEATFFTPRGRKFLIPHKPSRKLVVEAEVCHVFFWAKDRKNS